MKTIKTLFPRWPAVWLALFALLLAALACDLPGTPYDVFVSTSGNDSNDCRSAAHPCRTVQTALTKAATASVIHIGAGTFAGGVLVNKFVTLQGAGQTRTFINQTHTDTYNVEIGDPALGGLVTVTLNGMTLSGGQQTLGLANPNAHLIANNLTLTSAHWAEIDNTQGGRIELTNAILSNGAVGVDNAGTFSGNHLTVQGSSQYGLHNTGSMTLTDAIVQFISGGTALFNESAGGHGGQLMFKGGTITTNHGTALGNGPGATAALITVIIDHNLQAAVENAGTLTLSGVEVENNHLSGLESTGGTIQIDGSAFVNNLGGVAVGQSTLTMSNSTISGSPTGDGLNATGSSVNLSYVTVARNSRGLVYGTSTVTVRNSIIALNTVGNCLNFGGTLTLADANLACSDALTNSTVGLGSLGPGQGTMIIPLLAASHAIDHATGACPPVDQRGYTRPYHASCDIGAYEFGASLALVAATPGNGSPSDTPAPLAIVPSETPGATGTPTSAILEIVTVTPTAATTGTPSAQLPVTVNRNANCRMGPGTHYNLVTSYTTGQVVTPAGRNDTASWLLLRVPNLPDCWMDATSLTPAGPWDGLSVLTAPVLPDAPAHFTDSSVCTAKPRSQVVTLTWSNVANESGYHLYLDGKLLASLKPDVTSYVYKSDLAKLFRFQLEAYNSNGVSDQLTTTVVACP